MLDLIEEQICNLQGNNKINEYILSLPITDIYKYIELIQNGKFREYICNDIENIINEYKINKNKEVSVEIDINLFHNIYKYLVYIHIILLSVKKNYIKIKEIKYEITENMLEFLDDIYINKIQQIYESSLKNKFSDIQTNYKNFTITSKILSKYKINLEKFYLISGEINKINEKIITSYKTNKDNKMLIKKYFNQYISEINKEFDEEHSKYMCSIQ